METLISTTDFVLEQEKNIATQKAFVLNNKMFNYANFLKKKNKLGYFVPCDENDKPLEEPIFSIVNYGASTESVKYYEIDKKRYQEAKQRVLFEGFEIKDLDSHLVLLHNDFKFAFASKYKNEDWEFNYDSFELIALNTDGKIKLTDTAKKEIGIYD